MLSRNTVAKAAKPIVSQQTRGMATEKQIQMRIASTTNISKITKSMKMVSAAKMRGAQNRMDNGKAFSKWMDNFESFPAVRNIENEGVVEGEETGENPLVVAVSSDRGLCGGCNSFIAKATKKQLSALEAEGKEPHTMTIGEKARSQLRRDWGKTFNSSVADNWAVDPSFAQASAIASVAMESNPDADKVQIIFNKFVSAIAYDQSIRTVDMGKGDAFGKLINYEMEPDNREEFLADLAEFHLASAVFHAMVESNVSEESARMAAMENASTNASELIESLTLQYNQARQSRITTELIEIISGATALDES